jgi:hypothetical protein
MASRSSYCEGYFIVGVRWWYFLVMYLLLMCMQVGLQVCKQRNGVLTCLASMTSGHGQSVPIPTVLGSGQSELIHQQQVDAMMGHSKVMTCNNYIYFSSSLVQGNPRKCQKL